MAILHLSAVDVDLETGAVGSDTRLAATELALLTWLSAHPGEEVTRDRLLREVWRYPGAIPAETRAVDLAMARLRRKVERDPSKPDHLITVQGTGYRFVPLRPTPVNPLPRPANRFVGRAPEQARLRAVLDSGARLVTVVGPGGVGKTRLALEIASDRGNAVFCDASDATDGSGLAAAVHQALADRVAARHASVEALLAELGPVTVVLDNLEQVAAAAAASIPDWLMRAPGLTLVATSREPLALPDEHLVDVVPLLGARADEAVALLVERGNQLDVPLDPADPDVIALAHRMDGLPLGLELAAARLRTRRPAEIAADLGVVRRGVPNRHLSLDHAVGWSWDLLPPDEQEALATLAELRGAWTMAGAEALGVSPELVDRLVLRSLVQRYPETLRWGLLEAVRRFARARQRDPGAVADDHLRWALSDASASTVDLEAAFDHAIDRRAPELGAIFARMRNHLFTVGPLDRFQHVVRMQLHRIVDPSVQVLAKAALATVYEFRGDLPTAIDILLEAREGTGGAGLPVGPRSTVDGNLAGLYLRLGDHAAARRLARSAADAAREAGEPRHIAMRLQFLAGCETLAGRLHAADALLAEALACAAPWPATVGTLIHLLARVHHLLGRPVDALVDEAERLMAEVPREAANATALRITVLQDRGAFEAARALLPVFDAQVAPLADEVLLAVNRAVAHARDRLALGDRSGAAAILTPLRAAAGVDKWASNRVTPHLVACLPPDEAIALAEEALGQARVDERWIDVVQLLAAICAHPGLDADRRARAAAEGRALCDAAEVPLDAWLRSPFEG